MRLKIFKPLKSKSLYLLLIITVSGGFLRFYNLNWDEGHFFHPDERNIALAVSRIHFFDQLNPKFFAYGSFPIYLYRAIGDFLFLITRDKNWISNWAHINLIGRSVSALLSTFTILLVFLLSKRIWNEKIGLLSAFLVAFCPSLIQTAHFGVTESMLVFWLFLVLNFTFEIIEKPLIKNYFKIGTILGLATATKISSLAFLIIPSAAHFLYHFKYLKNHLKFLFSLFLAFVVFSFFSPYVFLDFPKFWESMIYESGVATGKLRVVYTLQFEKTLPYLFQIKNFFWQMGPIAFLGILGTILILIKTIKNGNKKLLVFLSFPISYFLYVGSWHTKFIRYMLPVLPFLIISSSWFIDEIGKHFPKAGKILIFLGATTTFFWAISFFSIYAKESTRITASRWIYQNIPKGEKLLTEHWDDSLPIEIPPFHPNQYKIEQLTIYDSDGVQKINYYSEKLSQADYIIVNSRRLYGTLINLPEKYPITSRYYKLLFSGQLGYSQIAEFSSYPNLFGLTINDDKSEETFQVYDHPKVIIFKNTRHFSSQTLKNILSYDK